MRYLRRKKKSHDGSAVCIETRERRLSRIPVRVSRPLQTGRGRPFDLPGLPLLRRCAHRSASRKSGAVRSRARAVDSVHPRFDGERSGGPNIAVLLFGTASCPPARRRLEIHNSKPCLLTHACRQATAYEGIVPDPVPLHRTKPALFCKRCGETPSMRFTFSRLPQACAKANFWDCSGRMSISMPASWPSSDHCIAQEARCDPGDDTPSSNSATQRLPVASVPWTSRLWRWRQYASTFSGNVRHECSPIPPGRNRN